MYDYVVNAVDDELRGKGLERTESKGDLTLVPAGGIEYGSNLPDGTPILPVYGGGPPPDMNATMWTGAMPSGGGSGPIVAKGSLTLEFVDQRRNVVIWNGTVTQALDPTRKEESLILVDKAVFKVEEISTNRPLTLRSRVQFRLELHQANHLVGIVPKVPLLSVA